MSDSVLMRIQPAVLDYVRVIAQVTQVNVEVVDRQFTRVAGTGIFDENIGESMEQRGFIYRRVMETARRHVIQNPARDDICRLCSFRESCQEKFEIVTPIFLGRTVLGIIALIATDGEQENKLRESLSTYLDFVEQMADFIATKARDQEEAQERANTIETLTQVVNNVYQCVIIRDDRGKVCSINSAACKYMKLSADCIGQEIRWHRTGDALDDLWEYKVALGEKEYVVVGKDFQVKAVEEHLRDILIFREQKQLRADLYQMTDLISPHFCDELIGSSRESKRLKQEILKVARSVSTVLITGESGTGKERVATAIWKASDRSGEAFVPINCAAIPDTLLESELFGYVKGAFTGASSSGRIGKFELANNGIIFLDEIGDIPFYLQAKLLRVLQEKKITRIGSNNQIDVDVRIIAATNQDLRQLIRENKFREDLYYRLNVIPLKIAPLRERIDELEELVFHFVARYSNRFGKYFDHIEPEVLDCLKLYDWPGNVRELENTVEFMINMMDEDGIITMETLPAGILEGGRNPGRKNGETSGVRSLAQLEQEEIAKAIRLYGDDTAGKRLAAQKLGIGIATLYRKLEKMGM